MGLFLSSSLHPTILICFSNLTSGYSSSSSLCECRESGEGEYEVSLAFPGLVFLCF